MNVVSVHVYCTLRERERERERERDSRCDALPHVCVCGSKDVPLNCKGREIIHIFL